MDPDIAAWILEFVLRQEGIEYWILWRLISALPPSSSPVVKRSILLRRISFLLSTDSISELLLTTLELLEELLHLSRSPSPPSLPSAYSSVAVECAARFLRLHPPDYSAFADTVLRVWNSRIPTLRRWPGGHVALISPQLWDIEREMLAAVDCAALRTQIRERDTKKQAVESIRALLGEAYDAMGPPFLVFASEAMFRKGRIRQKSLGRVREEDRRVQEQIELEEDHRAEEEIKVEDFKMQEQMEVEDCRAEQQIEVEDHRAEDQMDVGDCKALEQVEVEDSRAEEQIEVEDHRVQKQMDMEDCTAQEQIEVEDCTAQEQIEVEDCRVEKQIEMEDHGAEDHIEVEDCRVEEEQIEVEDYRVERQIEVEDRIAEEHIEVDDHRTEKHIEVDLQWNDDRPDARRTGSLDNSMHASVDEVRNGTLENKFDFLASPEVARAQAALKLSTEQLRSVVEDPLPNALEIAGAILCNSQHRDQMATEENQKQQDVSACHPSLEKDKNDPCVGDINAGDKNDGKQNEAWPGYMAWNKTAHTYEWDKDSIDSPSEESPCNSKQLNLPSPKSRVISPIKKESFANHTKRRKIKRWSVEEEQTLKEGVANAGVVIIQGRIACLEMIFYFLLKGYSYASLSSRQWMEIVQNMVLPHYWKLVGTIDLCK